MIDPKGLDFKSRKKQLDKAELENPPCDFDFGKFYKEWYRKD